jgi:polar amino acid transport system substrate-binding protein
MINRLGLILSLSLLVFACGEEPSPSKPETKPETSAAPATSETNHSPATDCQMTMGWDPWEPYQYLTPDDTVAGLEIELVTAIAKEAGCKLAFKQKSWMELLNGIRSGSVDILGGATKTPAREKFAWFSDPYRSESFILYVRAGEAGSFQGKTLEELLNKGFRVGVTQDYIYGDEVTRLQDDERYAKQFISAPMTEMNYYNLLQNIVDGFLEDPFVAAFTIKRKGLSEQIEAFPLEVHSGEVSLMFSKKSVSEDQVKAFNDALARIKANGTYDKIIDKYRR